MPRGHHVINLTLERAVFCLPWAHCWDKRNQKENLDIATLFWWKFRNIQEYLCFEMFRQFPNVDIIERLEKFSFSTKIKLEKLGLIFSQSLPHQLACPSCSCPPCSRQRSRIHKTYRTIRLAQQAISSESETTHLLSAYLFPNLPYRFARDSESKQSKRQLSVMLLRPFLILKKTNLSLQSI